MSSRGQIGNRATVNDSRVLFLGDRNALKLHHGDGYITINILKSLNYIFKMGEFYI